MDDQLLNGDPRDRGDANPQGNRTPGCGIEQGVPRVQRLLHRGYGWARVQRGPSSRPPQAEALLALVRGHWGVENGLHRTLDVQFREDDCRIRTGHAPAVMGIPDGRP